jgi:uncharacterized protein YecT (DUF1311 family)
MPARQLPKIALVVVVTVVACAAPDQRPARDSTASPGAADTTTVTTHAMLETLERDRTTSERELGAAEDSVYAFIGDTVAVLLKQAHTSWEQYRKLECDAIRVAFAEGSMAPVAHLECWIDLTDDHRKFIAQEYGYMRDGALPPPPRRR